MDDDSQGYLKVPRSLFRSDLWKRTREFSPVEAWLDLCQSAAYKPGSRFVRGQHFTVEPGQLIASVRFLAQRWGWTRMRTVNYLNFLKNVPVIRTETSRKQTTITILYLAGYANQADSDDTQDADSDRTTSDLKMADSETDKVEERNIEEGKDSKRKKKKKNAKPKIGWSPDDGWSGIDETEISNWTKTYPAVDVRRQLLEMNEWLLSNPARAKKTQWRRFITHWLSRSQERGGDIRSGYQPPTTGNGSKPTQPEMFADDETRAAYEKVYQRSQVE